MCEDETPDDRNVTEARETIGALLRAPYEAMAERLYAELAARGFADIRRAHSAVFRHIRPGGSRLTELAEKAGMAKQSMAYLVETLAAGGYVTAVPDPADGRARLVRLTARGRRVQETLLALGAVMEAECAKTMGSARFAELRRMLEELGEVVRRVPAGTTAGRPRA